MDDELQKTRQSLLLRLKAQDADAWSEFVAIYEAAIFRYCRSRGLQDADARDATQEVLAVLHDRAGDWDCDGDRGSLRAWLFRVARNTTVDLIRKRSRQAVASGDTQNLNLLRETPDSPDADALAIDFEYRRAMFQWAAELVKPEVRESTWRMFWLTAVEGRPAERVAEELNVSVGAVYTAKSRVVARVRAKIAEVDRPHGDFPDDPQ